MQSIIKNCWLKADILPKDDYDEIDVDLGAETQILLMHMKKLEEVQDLINKLDLENPFTANKFVQYDNSRLTAKMVPVEEILNAVLPNNNQEIEIEEIEELESNILSPITYSEAIKLYDKIILYLEQQEDKFNTKKEELKLIKKLQKEALKQRVISARQTKLDSYIVN
ncbi:hypothetical protein C1646_677244 [Rhizophagus diaphanus]|nr:hypothetical protein C1646_677244 [Rhizophagus diaphanus] [Rhizophagus sp. MUCL 43196]